MKKNYPLLDEAGNGGVVESVQIQRENISEVIKKYDSEKLDDDFLRMQLYLYHAAMRENFMLWLHKTCDTTLNDKAHEISHEVLLWMTMIDRSRLLDRLCGRIMGSYGSDRSGLQQSLLSKSELNFQERLEVVQRCSRTLTTLVWRAPINGLLLMALLEITSLEFKPWLKKLCKQLGIKKQDYLEVSISDCLDPEEGFVEAVIYENSLTGALKIRQNGCSNVCILSERILLAIFQKDFK